MSLRPIMPDDLPEVAAIEAAAAHAPWTERALADSLRAAGGQGWVAVHEGRIVGHLLGRTMADEAEVLTIAVHPDAQRQGRARQLLHAAAAAWARDAVTQAFLEVREDNAAARALYVSDGWETVGTRPRYYRDGTTAVLYRKAITRQG